MAYGGPATLDEVEPFLLDVRGGRETPAALVEEVKERYRAIGGGSPILELSREQARALEERLNREGVGDGGEWRVFVGMRHWHPYVREVVGEILAGGFGSLVALCLTPQESRMSVGAYFRALDDALGLGTTERVGAELASARAEPATPRPGRRRAPPLHAGVAIPTVARIRSWHDHPGFVSAVAARVVAALERFQGEERRDLRVVFTAHSLPESILREGDPYDRQVRETAAGVAERVAARIGRKLPWQVAYQSAGARAIPWLGPSLDEVLGRLAGQDAQSVLVAPVGFVSDHVEVLYDLDVEARARARELGLHLERTESLDAAPDFVAALADVVRTAAARGIEA
jgi:ferrochelatase